MCNCSLHRLPITFLKVSYSWPPPPFPCCSCPMVLLLLLLVLLLLMLLLPITDDGDRGDSAGMSDSVTAIETAAMITMTITARMIVLFIIHRASSSSCISTSCYRHSYFSYALEVLTICRFSISFCCIKVSYSILLPISSNRTK
jgi:hypothetical protein